MTPACPTTWWRDLDEAIVIASAESRMSLFRGTPSAPRSPARVFRTIAPGTATRRLQRRRKSARANQPAPSREPPQVASREGGWPVDTMNGGHYIDLSDATGGSLFFCLPR